MNKGIIYLLLVLFALTSATTDQQKSMKVDTSQSRVKWIAKQPEKQHRGFIKLKDGELIVDQNEIKGGSFTFDMRSISDIDMKDLGEKKEMESQLRSPQFFYVEKFPEAKFVITRVSKQQSNAKTEMKTTHRIEGDLTIKGVTKKISFDASINILNNRFVASTPPFTVNKTEWGVDRAKQSSSGQTEESKMLDDLTLEIELVSL